MFRGWFRSAAKAAAVAWPVFGRVAPPIVALSASTWSPNVPFGADNVQQPPWGTFVSCVGEATRGAAQVHNNALVAMPVEEHRTRLAESYRCYGKATDAVVATLGHRAVEDHQILSKLPKVAPT